MSQSIVPQSILITGASSGIGKALAKAYAAPGRNLVLHGRHGDRLAAVAADCEQGGATVRTGLVDVTDREAMADWITGVDREVELDLVVANAGISGFQDGDRDTVRRIFKVNVDGVFNTVQPILPLMAKRGRGQLALMSSLAGFRGVATAPGYAASKAAVRSYGEGLRGQVSGQGIAVSVVCPGFVRTPMIDDNPFPMILVMEPERAATIIQRGLERNKARIAFPLRLYLATLLFAVLPPAWTDPLFRRYQGKEPPATSC
ncbi:MAG: SDR family NAD(P)-dependent oxidoreductase [Geminicoccaceae bacterium]